MKFNRPFVLVCLTVSALLILAGLLLNPFSFEELPDCHTDTECYEWAVEHGLPESEYP